MPKREFTSGTASFAQVESGARLYSPTADRNSGPISDVLVDIAPATGRALEIASGTGQQIVTYARRMPGLHWQPSEVDADRRASVDAHVADAGLSNLSPAIDLDALVPGWGGRHGGQDLIVLANLVHLISTPELETLVAEAAAALAPGGVFAIYGPFLRSGEFTSDGDRGFHARLIAEDPDVGYKNDIDVIARQTSAGLEMARVAEMPANNVMLVARRP